jgi:hypothetical protein
VPFAVVAGSFGNQITHRLVDTTFDNGATFPGMGNLFNVLLLPGSSPSTPSAVLFVDDNQNNLQALLKE